MLHQEVINRESLVGGNAFPALPALRLARVTQLKVGLWRLQERAVGAKHVELRDEHIDSGCSSRICYTSFPTKCRLWKKRPGVSLLSHGGESSWESSERRRIDNCVWNHESRWRFPQTMKATGFGAYPQSRKTSALLVCGSLGGRTSKENGCQFHQGSQSWCGSRTATCFQWLMSVSGLPTMEKISRILQHFWGKNQAPDCPV